MKRIPVLTMLTALVALWTMVAFGGVPQLVNLQGILRDGSGNPVANGSYLVQFTIYDASSGGTNLWTETQWVFTTSGLFSVLLGSTSPVPDSAFNSPNRWLGVKVNADAEMTPRQQIVSMAYSFRVPHFIPDFGIHNTFIGLGAGNLTMTGNRNTASGAYALQSNTTGFYNTASGSFALRSNTTGFQNTASGSFALYNNTGGNFNTASGVNALYSNTTGTYNTASGDFALGLNSTGSGNTAVGYGALWVTTASDFNTAIGANAGGGFNNGYNNVFVGANTDVTGPDLYNVIAVGQATPVGGSSTARFGNAATVSYGGWADWTNVSDGRYKKNVRENVPGIEFIKKLRPITYNLDATGLDAFCHKNANPESQRTSPAQAVHERALWEKEQIVYTGFVAQEVEAAARTLGFDFSGVDAAKNGNEVYGLRYAEFVVPLVKAVQELGEENEQMKKELNGLRELLQGLLAKEGVSTPTYTQNDGQKGGSK